jgi:hypothetical protein
MPDRALVFACWPVPDPLLAGLGTEPALLELAGKPLAHRVIEQAVSRGARRINVVLGDQATPYVAALGGGERWGCEIVYHYLRAGDRPMRALARLLSPAESYLVLSAERMLPFGQALARNAIARIAGGEGFAWACGEGAIIARCMQDAGSRQAFEDALLGDPGLATMPAVAAPGADTAAGLLAAARGLLANPEPPIGIARRAASPGIWIGNGCRVHPSAELVAPVYLGDHVLVGPGAVVGPDAIVGPRNIIERGARITSAIVTPGSYAGPGIDLRDSLLDASRLVNVALGAAIEVPDRELAGAADGGSPPIGPGVLERAVAAVLWVVLWPARLVIPATPPGPPDETVESGIALGTPGAWARHLRERFHPGLVAVCRGRARIVGPAQRTQAERDKLPEDWQALHRRSLPGLLNDALLLGPEGSDPALRYAGDALAAKKLQTRHIAGAALRYARTVWTDRRSGSPAAAGPALAATPEGIAADRA